MRISLEMGRPGKEPADLVFFFWPRLETLHFFFLFFGQIQSWAMVVQIGYVTEEALGD